MQHLEASAWQTTTRSWDSHYHFTSKFSNHKTHTQLQYCLKSNSKITIGGRGEKGVTFQYTEKQQRGREALKLVGERTNAWSKRGGAAFLT